MAVQNPEHLDIEAFGGLSPFNRPVPGQSLTNDPTNKAPWESPPTFTTVQDATVALVEDCFSEENFKMIALALADHMPVGNLAAIILQEGFNKGAWNADLLMMLMEPLMYILMAIAEKCDIDYLLYEGDTYESYEDEDNPEEVLENVRGMTGKLRQELSLKDLKPAQIRKESLPEEVIEIIEKKEPPAEVISLLERREEPEQQNNSLLARE